MGKKYVKPYVINIRSKKTNNLLHEALRKNKKWEIHYIITGVTEEMKKALPKGLRCVNNKIKVPDYPHPLYKKFFNWCLRFSIENGFSL